MSQTMQPGMIWNYKPGAWGNMRPLSVVCSCDSKVHTYYRLVGPYCYDCLDTQLVAIPISEFYAALSL